MSKGRMTDKRKMHIVKGMYRRWLEDEKMLDLIAVLPEPEFGDIQEMLRNLGSAIAYGQAYVTKRSRTPQESAT